MTTDSANDAEQTLPPEWSNPPPGVNPDRVAVRMIRDDDIEPIVDHLLRCFEDGWPPFEVDCSVADHVSWKLNANTESWNQQVIATLEDDDRYVVALAIRIRRPGWVRGQERVILDVTDQSVHADWRRMHINQKRSNFRKTVGHDTHDLSFSWLPQHPATRKSSLEDPTFGNRVLVLWRPGSLRSLVSLPRHLAGWGHTASVVRAAIRGRFRRRPGPTFAGEIVDLRQFDDRTDAVWDAVKPELDFAIARTQDYLNWRYLDPRAGRFEARAAIEAGEVVGYCVTKPHADPASIVDLLVWPGRLDVVEALVTDAVARIDRERRRDIRCWLPQTHPYAAVIRQLGFLDSGGDPSARYSAETMADEDLEFLLDPAARVHVTEGDADFV